VQALFCRNGGPLLAITRGWVAAGGLPASLFGVFLPLSMRSVRANGSAEPCQVRFFGASSAFPGGLRHLWPPKVSIFGRFGQGFRLQRAMGDEESVKGEGIREREPSSVDGPEMSCVGQRWGFAGCLGVAKCA